MDIEAAEATLTLPLPDDAHLHLRDGERLAAVLPHSVAQFGRAVVMPNLKPPVMTLEDALAYRQRIMTAAQGARGTGQEGRVAGRTEAAGGEIEENAKNRFVPMMTLYLTPDTTSAMVRAAAAHPAVAGIKLYPAGATTHSEAGVTSLEKMAGVFATMAELGLPLLIHGEVTDPSVDIFDREKLFIEQHLVPLRQNFPDLKIVLEHITTAAAVDYVQNSAPGLAATITAHHLLYNRNAMFAAGLQPHWYCLPVLKREPHRQALLSAVRSGNPRFFLGTDSAPHARTDKESACGCAGCYTALHAIELYAWAFEQAGALDKLANFASRFAADFYGWSYNIGQMTLVRRPWLVPEEVAQGIVPLAAGTQIPWQIQSVDRSIELLV